MYRNIFIHLGSRKGGVVKVMYRPLFPAKENRFPLYKNLV